MSGQLYILKLFEMKTCDECDLVPSVEVIIDENLGTNELSAMDALQSLKRSLQETLKNAPVTNLRSMTREEINQWREENG